MAPALRAIFQHGVVLTQGVDKEHANAVICGMHGGAIKETRP